MRALRVAPAEQLPLLSGGDEAAEQLWWSGLPERARVEVLRLLARMIARGVLVDGDGDEPAGLC